jgi:hypothetical protein
MYIFLEKNLYYYKEGGGRVLYICEIQAYINIQRSEV